VSSTAYFAFWPGADSDFVYDNIRIASGDLQTTSVYEYDLANEQTKMTTDGVEMDFTYDDWGRMISRQMGGHTAAYIPPSRGDQGGCPFPQSRAHFAEHPPSPPQGGNVSDFPDSYASEAMNYDGLGKLRNYQNDDGVTWFRWDRGWNMLGMYGGTAGSWDVGDLFARFTWDPASMGGAPLAHTYIADPDIVVESENDRLGSARRIRETDTLFALGQSELGPYGETYDATGTTPFFTYTGHPRIIESDYNIYYSPYRLYSPDSARWTTRDPLEIVDGPNEYAYVRANPISLFDELGLRRGRCQDELDAAKGACGAAVAVIAGGTIGDIMVCSAALAACAASFGLLCGLSIAACGTSLGITDVCAEKSIKACSTAVNAYRGCMKGKN